MARINPDNIAKQQYKTAAPVGASDVRCDADVNAGRNEIGELFGKLSPSLQKHLGQQYETQKVEEINAGREWALKNQKESKKNLKDKDVATVNALSVWGHFGAEEIKGKRHAQEFKTQFELGLREAFAKKEGIALDPAGMNDYLSDEINKYKEENGIVSQIGLDSFRKETTAFIGQKNKNHLINSSALLEEMTIENIGDTIGASLNDLDFTKDGLKDMSDSALESWAKNNNVSGDIDEIKQAWKDKQEQNTIDQIQLFLDDQINKHPRIDINEITAKVLIQYGLSGDPEFMQKAIDQLKSGTGAFNTKKVQALLNANRGPLNDQRRKNEIDNDRTVSDLTIKINQYNGSNEDRENIIQEIENHPLLTRKEKDARLLNVSEKNDIFNKKISANTWSDSFTNKQMKIINGEDLKNLDVSDLIKNNPFPPEVDVEKYIIESIGEAILNRPDFKKENLSEILNSLKGVKKEKVEAYLFKAENKAVTTADSREIREQRKISRDEKEKFQKGVTDNLKAYSKFVGDVRAGIYVNRLTDFEKEINKFDFIPDSVKQNFWESVMADESRFRIKQSIESSKRAEVATEITLRLFGEGHVNTEVTDLSNQEFNKMAVEILRDPNVIKRPENWDELDDIEKESYFIAQYSRTGVVDPNHQNLLITAFTRARLNGPNADNSFIQQAYTTYRQYNENFTDGVKADDLGVPEEIIKFYDTIKINELNSKDGNLDSVITKTVNSKFIEKYKPQLITQNNKAVQNIADNVIDDIGYSVFTTANLNSNQRSRVVSILTDEINNLIQTGVVYDAAGAEDVMRTYMQQNFVNDRGNLVARHPINRNFENDHMVDTFQHQLVELDKHQKNISEGKHPYIKELPYAEMFKDVEDYRYSLIGNEYMLTDKDRNPVAFRKDDLFNDYLDLEQQIKDSTDEKVKADLKTKQNELLRIKRLYIMTPVEMEDVFHRNGNDLNAYSYFDDVPYTSTVSGMGMN